MTKKRWLILGLVIALAVVIFGIVVAEQQNKPKVAGMMPGCSPNPMPGPGAGFAGDNPLIMWERIAKALELSPEQKKDIETIFLNNNKKNIQLKADLEVQQVELFIALREPNTNEAKVKEISKKIGRLTAETIETGIDDVLKAKKVLNPEQQGKAIQMILMQILQKKQQPNIPMGMGQPPMMMGAGPGMMPMGPGHKAWKEQGEQKEESEESESK